jgi:glycosyltransferase involved in cell wall biosynthesis
MNYALLGRESLTMGGGEPVTTELARELEARGHDVTVFTPPFDIPGDPDNDGVSEIEEAREREPFNIVTTNSLIYSIPGVPLLWKKMILHPWLAFSQNKDQLFDHWFVTYGLYPITEYWTRHGLSASHYFHGPIIADKCGPLQKYTVYPPLSVIYKAADIAGGTSFPAASNSELTRRRVRKEHNIESEVIYPPVNVDAFADSISANSVPDGHFALLSGRYVPFKKFERGLEHLESAVQDGVLDSVVVAGRLENENYFQKLRKQYPYADFRTDVPGDEWIALHQEATAYVFSNYEEDFGLTGAEAAAAGAPVITPDRPGIAEVLRDWEHGYIVDKELRGAREPIEDIIDSAADVSPCSQIDNLCSTEVFVDQMLRLAGNAGDNGVVE